MSKWVMFGVWTWFVATILSAFSSGAFIGETQRATLDKLMLFTVWHIWGLTIPIINLDFFTGIWNILQPGNFAFLQSNPLLIVVYLTNIGIVVGFFTLFSALITSFIRR